MKNLLVFIFIILGCTHEVEGQITNDAVTIMTVPGDHVLVNKPRVLVYPSLTTVSSEIASLDNNLIGKKVNVLVRIHQDKVEYLELRASSRLSQDAVDSADKLFKSKVKYFLLDKPVLQGAEYFDFSYVLKINLDASK